ncbi:MAG TPA: hypothetical protein VLE27_10265, partial [Thermoanaerobaculia bacterium]|nr:hypothetical protein [Thermoanaerobaculia bacterium]
MHWVVAAQRFDPESNETKCEVHMLRTSSYTIFVDLQGNDQDVLLVHGYTGAYDRVSRRVAD